MGRITFEGNFCDISMCRENPCPYNGMCSQRETWERLKKYEETDLVPDEIRWMGDLRELKREIIFGVTAERLKELAEADKNGRLVVLPCKVGDVVYGFHQERTILPMVAKWIETDADGWTVAAQYAPMAPKFYLFSDFGKTVFLTREEAEAALKGGDR